MVAVGRIPMSFRVLYDLALAAEPGFAGIPQETRLLFFGLAQSEQIELAGLLRPHQRSDYRRRSLKSIDAQAGFIGPFLGQRVNNLSLAARALSRLHPKLAHAYQLFFQGRNITTRLHAADPSLTDVIWRQFFVATVPADARQLIAQKSYYFSKLGNDRIAAASVGLIPTPRLNTEGFDFLVTQDARPVKVSRRTVKVVRYHDGIPVTAADTVPGDRQIRVHVATVRRAAEDSVFVCNSTSALADLGSISPKGAARAIIIPNVIPRMERTESNRRILQTIMESRVSSSTISDKRQRHNVAAWFGDPAPGAIPQYIMSLATIEPRKNYIRLIEAWRELRQRTGADIKLMIVGALGWIFEPTLSAMRPYMERGELLHLSGVRQAELPYLYSMAAVFAFPSFAEGFGMPPTEAMQCGCPVVLSDIAAHQFMAGDAALYCDPYDVQSIATALECSLASKEVRQLLVERGYRNVKRFSLDTLLPAWEDLFSQASLASGRHRTPNPQAAKAPVVWRPAPPMPATQRNIETLLQAARSEAAMRPAPEPIPAATTLEAQQ